MIKVYIAQSYLERRTFKLDAGMPYTVAQDDWMIGMMADMTECLHPGVCLTHETALMFSAQHIQNHCTEDMRALSTPRTIVILCCAETRKQYRASNAPQDAGIIHVCHHPYHPIILCHKYTADRLQCFPFHRSTNSPPLILIETCNSPLSQIIHPAQLITAIAVRQAVYTLKLSKIEVDERY